MPQDALCGLLHTLLEQHSVRTGRITSTHRKLNSPDFFPVGDASEGVDPTE